MGSSFNVLVGFTWGIFIFDEHVHSRLDSCLAVGCMMIGILGMAYYSVPSDCPLDDIEGDRDGMLENGHEYHRLDCQDVDDPEHSSSDRPLDANHCVEEDAAWMTGPTDPSPEALLPISRDDDDEGDDLDQTMSSSHIMCLGMVWSRRTLGILSAMFSGIYGGSLMVPMKWVPTNAKGSHYVISFAVGASTVNLTLWIIRTLYLSVRSGSLTEGYNALPPMYLKQMWKYGTACGLLWSIGNFCSILAVEFLGEGVGYSLVQSSLLGRSSCDVVQPISLSMLSNITMDTVCSSSSSSVSGLWGIFFFGEVKGCATISKWFLSAAITLLGILILSYEHHKK